MPTSSVIGSDCGPDMARAPRRILITGASGFVGRHLTARLAAACHEATVFTPSFDVRDRELVAATVRHIAPDVCIHLAAVSTVRGAEQDEDQAWRINLHGTLDMARAIRRHAPECLMLFVSSADAYGDSFRAGTPLTETAALAPMSTYAATKAAADLALGSMAEQGLRCVRLRPFNHTGPGQSEQFVVAAFARQVARIAAGLQPPVLEVGNIDARRDFLDVRDVCAAYLACVDKATTLPPGAILNLASGKARRVGDILSDLQALAGITAEVRVDPARKRKRDVPFACGDATLAREGLGWTPAITWERTLRDVFDDWRTRVRAPAEET
ncbi:MAG TPA: GDP-mannose 4,6-dehydratase [Acetobacteraceae bacterium]